jgi:hypothetical protein
MPDNLLPVTLALSVTFAGFAGVVAVLLYFVSTRIYVRTYRETHGRVSVMEVTIVIPVSARRQVAETGMIPSWEFAFYFTWKSM